MGKANKKTTYVLYIESHDGRGPFVGKYCVHVNEFEAVALPVINPFDQDLLIIDEVGKMELKSKKFEFFVHNCLMKTKLLVTVPCNLRQNLQLVDKLKSQPNARLIVVTKENRNNLQSEIVKLVLVFEKINLKCVFQQIEEEGK